MIFSRRGSAEPFFNSAACHLSPCRGCTARKKAAGLKNKPCATKNQRRLILTRRMQPAIFGESFDAEGLIP